MAECHWPCCLTEFSSSFMSGRVFLSTHRTVRPDTAETLRHMGLDSTMTSTIFLTIFTLVIFEVKSDGQQWSNVAVNKTVLEVYINKVPIPHGEYDYYWGWGKYSVDGNEDTRYPCSASMDSHWIVDLRKLYLIKGLEITLLDHADAKLLNFRIEMSRFINSSELINPALCHYNPSSQPCGTTARYECPRPMMGRYVSISRDSTVPYLFLCEVKVYGTAMELNFDITSRPGKRSVNSVIGRSPVSSILRCLLLCRETRPCTSVNIQHSEVITCELIEDPVPWQFDNETPDPDWTHYVMEL